MIDIRDLYYSYKRNSGTENKVLNGINLCLGSGEFTALMGANGSGKSTLALCIKGIIKPSRGKIFIDELDINNEKTAQKASNLTGIVLQNPDNQFISTSVEREIAFGLENRAFSPTDIKKIVLEQLNRFSLRKYRNYSPERLSGGEKQKVLLASVIASNPKYLVLDEATSYLDPYERKRIINLLKGEFSEKSEDGFSILLITQCPFEALEADRLIIINKGQIVYDDTPDKVFNNTHKLINMGIKIPLEYELLEL